MFKQNFRSISDLRTKTNEIEKLIKKREEVTILEHNKPKFVLINYEEYLKMIQERQANEEDLRDLLQAIAEADEKPESLKSFKKRFPNWK